MNYPNQLDDKNSLFEVKDLGRTSTSKSIDAVELEIEIDNPINFPTGRHIVVVDSEVIIISHRIGNILYAEKRGAFDTLSDNHVTNSKIGVVFTSAHYEVLRDTIIDIQKEIWTYRKPVNDVLDDPQTIIPSENESYLVGLSPLNEFTGKENNISTWNGTSWDFIPPQPAFEMYILNKGKYEFDGTSWVLNKDVEISNVNDLQNQLDNRYTKSETYNKVETNLLVDTKQDNLVSGTNIKTINGKSVLGSGDIEITGGGSGGDVDLTDYYTKSETDSLVNAKQDTLVSGTSIKTINGSNILSSGNLALLDATNPSITGSITEQVYNLTGTEINPSNGTIQYKTVSANTTFTETLTAGQSVLLRLIGANGKTITFPTIAWVGAAAPTLTANCAIVLWKEQSVLYGAFVGTLV